MSDALLFVSFGGPEGPDDVIPFLENVLRGKNVPRERMLEVAEHYKHFGGVSPINEQNRQLIAALEAELAAHNIPLKIYWGNRNWHPLLPDTLQQMADDGVENALAYITSAFSSYSGCRQYREDIERAQAAVGGDAPQIHKLRAFFNHPGFIEPTIENVQMALNAIPADRRDAAVLAFTSHSIPNAMAENCRYEEQLLDACETVSDAIGGREWKLVYQSRSGPPMQPWLEPDIGDHLRTIRAAGTDDVVVMPIGFVSDHLEVIWDLDTEAQQIAGEIGLNMVRAATVGHHPRFVTMIRELVEERLSNATDRPALGKLGPSHDVCPDDCCLYTPRRPPHAGRT